MLLYKLQEWVQRAAAGLACSQLQDWLRGILAQRQSPALMAKLVISIPRSMLLLAVEYLLLLVVVCRPELYLLHLLTVATQQLCTAAATVLASCTGSKDDQ